MDLVLVGRKGPVSLWQVMCACVRAWECRCSGWSSAWSVRREIILISYHVPVPDTTENFTLSHLICTLLYEAAVSFHSHFICEENEPQRDESTAHISCDVCFGYGTSLGLWDKVQTRLHVSKTHSPDFITSCYLLKYAHYIFRSQNIRKQDQRSLENKGAGLNPSVS